VREFPQTWRGTRTREGKEITLRSRDSVGRYGPGRRPADDLEEDKAARAVVFGLLAEMQRK
jgi:hypothetical protein